MHPSNNTYPLFTAQADDFEYEFNMHFDHDRHRVKMYRLEITDHSNYPHTLDPAKVYKEGDEIKEQKILTRRSNHGNQNMMEMSVLMFHFPMERTCPLCHEEKYKIHDKFIQMKMNCAKLNFMQEYIFRLYEYFFFQVLAAMSDSNPYLAIRSEANDVFRALLKQAKESDEIEVVDPSKCHPHWTILNAHIFSEL